MEAVRLSAGSGSGEAGVPLTVWARVPLRRLLDVSEPVPSNSLAMKPTPAERNRPPPAQTRKMLFSVLQLFISI